ncbi:hypothetical protein PR048_000639 [Dryococelus australis]|uniref:Peptidase A2 domain-containing protein n=1 Tax=Dryococelus australis TaxID=614101 RepID=A0ABQ9IGF2_9NEOP|nr:hypothetical protein PR048_000639 [Dryococelus australis]
MPTRQKVYQVGDESNAQSGDRMETVAEMDMASSYWLHVDIEGQPVVMELDTGAAVSVLPEPVYLQQLQHLECNQKTVVPALMAARLQCWAVVLVSYDYEIRYKPGERIPHADVLSRLPVADDKLMETDEYIYSPVRVFTETIKYFAPVLETPLLPADIGRMTNKYPVWARENDLIRCGWSDRSNGKSLTVYLSRKNELIVEEDCILLGRSATTTSSLQHRVDNDLFSCRNIPSSTAGATPAELFLGRKTSTRLTILKPTLNLKMQTKQIDKQLESFSICAPRLLLQKGTVFAAYGEGRKVELGSGSSQRQIMSRRWTWSIAAALMQPAAGSVEHQQPLGSGVSGVCSPPLGDQLVVEEALTPIDPEGLPTVGGFKGFPNDGGSSRSPFLERATTDERCHGWTIRKQQRLNLGKECSGLGRAANIMGVGRPATGDATGGRQ